MLSNNNYSKHPSEPQSLHPPQIEDHTKDTNDGHVQSSQEAAWQNVEEVLAKHHHKPDLEAARAVYAAYAAHKLADAPVWIMIVAPPGSMKTVLLEALDGLQGVYLIDQITANTFISGQIKDSSQKSKGKSKGKRSPSLLNRIGGNGVLIYPDFSTILGMKPEQKASVLADMRRIFDGKLRKEYGTTDLQYEHEWKGRVTFLVAATPDVDRAYGIFQTLGERFLMVRASRPNGVPAALIAMNQDKKVKVELRAAVHSLFKGMKIFEPTLSPEFQLRIAALTEVVVRGRTNVPRDGHTKEVIYVPEPEAPTRLAQQLAQLSKGAALLEGRKDVSERDYALVRRVAFDCIPAIKRKILEAAINGKEVTKTLPYSTRNYAIHDLELEGLIKDNQLSESAQELLTTAGVLPCQE